MLVAKCKCLSFCTEAEETWPVPLLWVTRKHCVVGVRMWDTHVTADSTYGLLVRETARHCCMLKLA